MKLLKMRNYAILIALITTFAGCSSDDGGNDVTDDTSGQPGDPHHYDVTVDGQTYEGDVDNVYGTDGENGAITATSTYAKLEGRTYVEFSLQNNDMLLVGSFNYPNGNDGDIALSDGDNDPSSVLTLIPGDPVNTTEYTSESASASLGVGEKISFAPGSGASQFAELTVDFNGTFSYKNEAGEEITTQASGTVKINLPPGY